MLQISAFYIEEKYGKYHSHFLWWHPLYSYRAPKDDLRYKLFLDVPGWFWCQLVQLRWLFQLSILSSSKAWFLGRKPCLKITIFIKNSTFRDLSWSYNTIYKAEIFSDDTYLSLLTTVKISDLHLLPNKSYETPKVSKKGVFSSYSMTHRISRIRSLTMKLL